MISVCGVMGKVAPTTAEQFLGTTIQSDVHRGVGFRLERELGTDGAEQVKDLDEKKQLSWDDVRLTLEEFAERAISARFAEGATRP